MPYEGTKLWLWKHADSYLAFDNPMPCFPPDGGDPMVLGEPVATTILVPSVNGWESKVNKEGQL